MRKCMCEQAQELRKELEGVRQINRIQAEVLAEEQHMNRLLNEALKQARNEG